MTPQTGPVPAAPKTESAAASPRQANDLDPAAEANVKRFRRSRKEAAIIVLQALPGACFVMPGLRRLSPFARRR